MGYRVQVADEAKQQLIGAFQWYVETATLPVANRWYDGFLEKLESLSHSPERCSLADESDGVEDREVRQCFYGEGRGMYRILYMIEEDTVVVLSIRHCARQIAGV